MGAALERADLRAEAEEAAAVGLALFFRVGIREGEALRKGRGEA